MRAIVDGVAMGDLDHFQERHPLNSRLVKRDGTLTEEVYRVGGRYDAQIGAIVSYLRAAIPYAGDATVRALAALVRVYETGETEDRRQYDIAWVQDQASPVDAINGFTEVYLDACGIKGSWESVVFSVNREKAEGIRKLAHEAQWFEDGCQHQSDIFGRGGGEETAGQMEIPFLGRIPIDEPIRRGSDTGQPVVLSEADYVAAQAFLHVAEQTAAQVSIARCQPSIPLTPVP
jgi:hypothetical protein